MSTLEEGGLSAWGVCLLQGEGCLLLGGVCSQEGGSAWGVCLLPGGGVSASDPRGCIPACNGVDTPNGQTDTCEHVRTVHHILHWVLNCNKLIIWFGLKGIYH